MAIIFRTLEGCCQGELQTETKVSCANTLVLFVALAALAAAIIGIFAVAAHLSHGIAGLGAISELGLPGGVTLTILGIIGVAALATLLVKRCTRPPVPPHILKELRQTFEQELAHRKANALMPHPSTAVTATTPQIVADETCGLATLPDEILLVILKYLDDKSLISFGLTNKKHNIIINGQDFISCFIRMGLRKEAFHRWQEMGLWKEALVLSQVAEKLAPFYSKTMLKTMQQTLDSIHMLKKKESALCYVTYTLQGICRTADQESVIALTLQLFSVTIQLAMEREISHKDMQTLLGDAFKSLARDLRLADRCLDHIKKYPFFTDIFHELFIFNQIECLANSDKAFVYLEKIQDLSTREKLLCTLLGWNVERHSNENNILSIGRYIEAQGYVGNKCLCKLAGAYAFIGEFDKAYQLKEKIEPHRIGKLIESIISHCNWKGPNKQSHLVHLLNWTKELLATEKQNHILISAFFSILDIMRKSDPFIEDLILENRNNDENTVLISLGLSFIETEKAFKLAKEIKSSNYKIALLVILAQERKLDKARVAELLDSAFEAYNNLNDKDNLTIAYTAQFGEINVSYMAEFAELYSLIDLDKAEKVFNTALKAAITKNGQCFDECRLPLIKAYIALQKIHKTLDKQTCLAFIKKLVDQNEAYLFVTLADKL